MVFINSGNKENLGMDLLRFNNKKIINTCLEKIDKNINTR